MIKRTSRIIKILLYFAINILYFKFYPPDGRSLVLIFSPLLIILSKNLRSDKW